MTLMPYMLATISAGFCARLYAYTGGTTKFSKCVVVLLLGSSSGSVPLAGVSWLQELFSYVDLKLKPDC